MLVEFDRKPKLDSRMQSGENSPVSLCRSSFFHREP